MIGEFCVIDDAVLMNVGVLSFPLLMYPPVGDITSSHFTTQN